MATHSSILAWRIPWTEKPGGYSPRGCKESYTTEQHTHTDTHTHTHTHKASGAAGSRVYLLHNRPMGLGPPPKGSCYQGFREAASFNSCFSNC